MKKYWEIIADNLSKAGWSWGCVSALDYNGRTIWIADAHRDDRKRFVVRADEKLTALVELELVIALTNRKSDCISFAFTQRVYLRSRFSESSSRISDHAHLRIEITLIRLLTKSHNLDHQNLHLLVLPFGNVEIRIFWVSPYCSVNPRYKFAADYAHLFGFVKKVILK